jgi:hypothetical protein
MCVWITPIIFPIISPAVKNPRTSANMTPPAAICARSTLRRRESIVSGLEALEDDAPDRRADG